MSCGENKEQFINDEMEDIVEKTIGFKNEMGARELRQLHELSNLNKALIQEEYMQIVLIYQRVIERLTIDAEKQGIEI